MGEDRAVNWYERYLHSHTYSPFGIPAYPEICPACRYGYWRTVEREMARTHTMRLIDGKEHYCHNGWWYALEELFRLVEFELGEAIPVEVGGETLHLIKQPWATEYGWCRVIPDGYVREPGPYHGEMEMLYAFHPQSFPKVETIEESDELRAIRLAWQALAA